MRMPLYQLMAQAGEAAHICARNGNGEWQQAWQELLAQCEELLPSGSGFDAGTSVVEASSERIVLQTSYHHMSEYGHYEEWTEHTVTVVPDLASGFHLRISGRNRNHIKEYIEEVFDLVLRSEVVWDRKTVKRAQ